LIALNWLLLCGAGKRNALQTGVPPEPDVVAAVPTPPTLSNTPTIPEKNGKQYHAATTGAAAAAQNGDISRSLHRLLLRPHEHRSSIRWSGDKHDTSL